MVLDQQGAGNLFKNIMDLWVRPEIERRRRTGGLPHDFDLKAAQVLFRVGRDNEVRLNEEVEGVLEVTLKGKRQLRPGGNVFEHDAGDVQSISLLEKDANAAHVTLLRLQNNWTIVFDFHYNRELSREHIEAASEFLSSAEEDADRGRKRAFFETAFACAELAAKAILLLLPDEKVLAKKEHGYRIDRFRALSIQGHVDAAFSQTLDELWNLRRSARYLENETYACKDPGPVLDVLRRMVEHAKKQIDRQ